MPMGAMFMTMMIAVLVPLFALVLLGGLVIAAIKAWRGNPSRPSKQSRDEETRLIQEIYQGLTKMEKRVEALETILLGPERRGRHEADF
jgi:phage shock protein B